MEVSGRSLRAPEVVSEEATLIRLVGVTRALLDTLADDRLAALVDSQTLARVRALRDRADARLRDLTDAQDIKGGL